MPRSTDSTNSLSAIVYFIGENGKLQTTDINSDLYKEVRNSGRLFIISKPTSSTDQTTISIPIAHLEAIAPSELHKLVSIVQKLSGDTSHLSSNSRFDVLGIANKQAEKIAEKLLKELIELPKAQKPNRSYSY